MYQQDRNYYSSSSSNFPGSEESYDSGYGHNYKNYRLPNEAGLKGKIEQKYWRSKQKVIEKLGKDQDEFVISGDSEVDARLEAFQHIKMTCMQLMFAIECYQNKIFALSQDENEMGRFLRDQGALDKTKAGKMMLSVGKAQSFAAQQRLGLRAALARLSSELETFRFRAIQDTQITVSKMEQSRSDYRARLLWMADISKELDPDQNKRLDKFRDVQLQVKQAKAAFDKLKADVVQKIDLLSASRCNLLSATLEPYQTAMISFLSSTSKSYNEVYEQFKGYPSFQFQVLKNIIPNNGIVDDDEAEEDEEADEKKETKQTGKKSKGKDSNKKSSETAEETDKDAGNIEGDSDDKLINFGTPPKESNVVKPKNQDLVPIEDLLGSLNEDVSPGFGEYADDNTSGSTKTGFEDLLDQYDGGSTEPSYGMSLLGGCNDSGSDPNDFEKNVEEASPSVDELLFGISNENQNNDPKSDMDLLSDVLNNQSLGISEFDVNNSFSSQWQSMFATANPEMGNESLPQTDNKDIESNMTYEDSQSFMPSFLLDQIGKSNPPETSKTTSNNKDASKFSKTMSNILPGGSQNQKSDSQGKDMSAWLNLFAELDPLSNPDAVGASEVATEGKQAC